MYTQLSKCLSLTPDDKFFVIRCPVCKSEVRLDKNKYLFNNIVGWPSFFPSIRCKGECKAHFVVAKGMAEILNTPKWPDPPKKGDKLPL